MKWQYWLLGILAFAVFLFFYTIIGLAFVNRWVPPMSGKVGDVLFDSNQPTEIKYDDFGPYELHATRQISRTYPFGETNYATIKVFHAGHSDYYWSMDISSESDFSAMAAKWTNDGVELTTVGGIRHFIPKKCFIGGR